MLLLCLNIRAPRRGIRAVVGQRRNGIDRAVWGIYDLGGGVVVSSIVARRCLNTELVGRSRVLLGVQTRDILRHLHDFWQSAGFLFVSVVRISGFCGAHVMVNLNGQGFFQGSGSAAGIAACEGVRSESLESLSRWEAFDTLGDFES